MVVVSGPLLVVALRDTLVMVGPQRIRLQHLLHFPVQAEQGAGEVLVAEFKAPMAQVVAVGLGY